MAKVNPSYNLQVINPTLSTEWHPTKNGSLTPKDVTPNSSKKVWWMCKKKHEWKVRVAGRNLGAKCPYCSGKLVTKENNLQKVNPKLAKEWHPTKNGNLTPKDITAGNNKKVWWQCRKDHEWQAIVRSRVKGAGCPFCKGLYASKEKNLQVIDPELAKQWHPVKNGNLTPKDVLPYSIVRVWWQCKKGHEWQASIAYRTKRRGCPSCSRKKATKEYNLQMLNPKLAGQWHPTKNGDLTPENILPGSNKKVWWKCKKGHDWKAYVFARNKGTGCPHCNRQERSFSYFQQLKRADTYL